jgi:AcrR family transcriptional regulator
VVATVGSPHRRATRNSEMSPKAYVYEQPTPRTAKGRRAVAVWRRAGREAFTSLGFLSTKLSDIANIAGMGSASFYNYYDSKEDLLLDLAAEYNKEVLSRIKRGVRAGDPRQNLRATVQTFWRVYTENQAVMHGVFQLSMLDEQFARHWYEIRERAIAGIAAEIRRAKKSSPSPTLDTEAGAIALSSMLEHFCYLWSTDRQSFVEGKTDEEAISTIANVWFRALYGAV